MDRPKILIFLGSVRTGRMCERVGKFVRKAVEANQMEAIVFDPDLMPFELLKMPIHFMKNPELEAPLWLIEANETIKKVDGFIMVSAEYNCGIPPALSNMIDHFPPSSYRHRPCGFVTYSMSAYGGVRVFPSLSTFANELGMLTVPERVSIPVVHMNVDEEGNCKVEKSCTALQKMMTELNWHAKAIKSYQKVEPLPIYTPSW